MSLRVKTEVVNTIYSKVPETSVGMQIVSSFWFAQTENFQTKQNFVKGKLNFPNGIVRTVYFFPPIPALLLTLFRVNGHSFRFGLPSQYR